MSPRYVPKLTDGIETRSLQEWRSFAKGNGLILEPLELRSPVNFRIIDCACPKVRVIKKLRKLKRV